MRQEYQAELKLITNKVIKMGGILEDQINLLIIAIEKTDKELANQIINNDDKIDEIYLELEKNCIEMIARQNPLASDLRRIVAILKMSTDVEKIADHCGDIAEYIVKIASSTDKVASPNDLIDMTIAMKKMVVDTVNAFVDEDEALTYEVVAADLVVNKYFYEITRHIISELKENPQHAKQYVYYLMISKYIEKIGDHSANIARWIQYMLTGERIEKEI